MSGSLTLILLSGAAVLVTGALYATEQAATERVATAQADQITLATAANARLGGSYGSLPYEIVRSDGVLVSSSPELSSGETRLPLLPVPVPGADRIVDERWTVTIPNGPLAGHTLTALSRTIHGDDILGGSGGDIPGGTVVNPSVVSFRVYVVATTASAERSIAALSPYLWGGVLLAVALVTTAAAVSARRALRPVTQMRVAADGISGAPRGRRIAAPRADNELRSLAMTINALLDRVDAAAERQDRFTADAAHELRTPISSLIAALEIARAYPTMLDLGETLDHVHDEAYRLRHLADDLLELGSASHASETGRTAVADAVAAVAKTVETLRRTHYRPSLTIDVVSAVTRLDVAAAPDTVCRVLTNLLDNAARHARSRVEVIIALNPARIEVINDGPEIPAESLERVFDPFVRLDDARSRSLGGSGLGLAIAKELTAQFDGGLHVTSTPLRTAFTIALPHDAE